MRVQPFMGTLLLALLSLQPAVAHAQGPKPPAAAAPKPAAAPARPPAAVPKNPKAPARPGAHADPRKPLITATTTDDARIGADTPELSELARAERELFPPSLRDLGNPWPTDLPGTPDDPLHPRVRASGLPSPPPPPSTPVAEGGKDVSWIAKLEMPDLPIRWDARVVRYIEFFKDDPRGRAIFTVWMKRSGRYRDAIRKTLRKKGLPEDLLYLAMAESGFESTARSPAGAQGVWQFMPETGRLFGLTQDRWADQRLNVPQATEAAADYLADLYRRFGTWELAMASYNMGSGGVTGALRRYNTNDYWALSKAEGSLPWETTLYVPKILALAVLGRNAAALGFRDLALEGSLEGQDVTVPPATSLASVAQAAGVTLKEITERNPELRAQRTPPGEPYSVKVPPAKAALCAQNLPKVAKAEPQTEKYTVRFGESLEQIAAARGTTTQKLVELNALGPQEVVRGGTVLLVPPARNAKTIAGQAVPPPAVPTSALPAAGSVAAADAPKDRPTVVVPQDVFVYPDRTRVFYRVIAGDQLADIARTFKVSVDDLRRWNEIEPAARLIEGMTLQMFLPQGADVSQAVLMRERDVTILHAGSDEFFARFEDKGRKRLVVSAKPSETLEALGRRYGVSASLMERINRRPRSDVLKENENVVVYLPGAAPAARMATSGAGAGGAGGAQAKTSQAVAAPAPQASLDRNEPIAEPMTPLSEVVAPAPELLPPLPN
jgi:membrane-bound lytic murein transglycosylase D